MTLPPALAALRDEAMTTTCEAWAIRKRWPLQKGIDRAGPCPMCGGTDRFAIHTRKNTFNCRQCGIAGAGVIDLVMATEPCEFLAACEIVTGRKADTAVDEAQAAEWRRQAEASEAARATEAERYRQEARRRAWEVWDRGVRGPWAPGDPVAVYLEQRGISVEAMLSNAGVGRVILRRANLPWREKQGDVWVTLHEGPVMLAAVQQPDGHFGAIHQTWLDGRQPKGKLVLPADAAGKDRAIKKVIGIKKGGAIRLATPDGARRIVMGEGIETTLTALAHAHEPSTAYWAGVDLGNMAGKAARNADGGQLWDQPDMGDTECFLPPEWCEELVYLCDSDEPRNHTEEKVVRGLRRAMALREAAIAGGADLPPLQVSYVPPLGGGRDLNDLVRVAT